jgi:hypothetical protein
LDFTVEIEEPDPKFKQWAYRYASAKEDETLAHPRYLPRMGKGTLLRGLGASVVNSLA